MKRKSTRLLAALFAMVLAVTTFAMPAYAATVKKPLITQIKFNYISDGKQTNVNAFKYNKKGLLTQRKVYVQSNKSDVIFQVDYKYNSKNLVKSATIKENGQKTAKVTYTYNSKKKITKRVTKFPQLPKASATVKYTYKNGKLKSSATTYKEIGWRSNGTEKVTYTLNKKGLITKSATKNSDYVVSRSFVYDKNGFWKKQTYKSPDGGMVHTRKLTYKKGALTKYQDTVDYGGDVDKDHPRTVVTKKHSVPKKLSKTVTNQQREILNGYDIYLGFDYM